MTRMAMAFIISIVAHVAIISGISMPMHVPMHQERLSLQITYSELLVNGLSQEELLIEDEIRPELDIPESPIADASTDSAPDVVNETSQPVLEPEENSPEEIETGLGDSRGTTAGEGSGDNGSHGTSGEGSNRGNFDGQGNGVPSQDVTDGAGTLGDGGGDENPLGPDLDAIRANYRQRVLSAIDSEKEYPQAARRLGQEGEVAVRITVLSDGTVTGITMAQSSGIESLDSAARNAINSASPLPPIPDELGVTSLVLSLQIVFSLD